MSTLSMPVAAAFRDWKAATEDLQAACGSTADDDIIAELGERVRSAVRSLATTPAATLMDLAVKVHLLMEVECDECGRLSPLTYQVEADQAEYEETYLKSAICKDLPRVASDIYSLSEHQAIRAFDPEEVPA